VSARRIRSASHERARDVSALPESKAEGGREADGVVVVAVNFLHFTYYILPAVKYGVFKDESQSVGKTNLPEMQSSKAQGRSKGNLFGSKA